jgi:hypothetical protein
MHYNRLKLEESRFRKENLIYLLRRNIRTIRSSNKFNYKKFAPFKIKRNIKNINYELYFPLIIRIHPVFHISLLELANLDALTKPVSEIYPNL